MEKYLQTEIKNFDIIHIHEARSFQHVIVWQITLKRGVPYVVQAHGNLSSHFGGFPRRIYDEIFGKKVIRSASKVIAVSKVEALDYMKFGVNEEKIEFIPNPIDIDEFSNHHTRGTFREKYNIDPDSKVILFMGRIHPIKGIDILLYAFAKMIKDSKVNATLVVAGPDDGFLKKCIGIVKTYNINNVIFPGQLDDMERIDAYVDADVVVLPSRYETFSMTVLEAYACGKPVIASNVGGLRDLVIDKETGILVEPGNVNELSRALLVSLSEDNIAKWGLRAREFVKQFSVEKVVDKLEQIYVNVLR
jgi:glycosyltransferase involved in cell wall biosynthesis